VRRLALAALGAVALAGCSSATKGSGRATVWVTRDRGAIVLHVAKIPAGLTAMQGLERVAKVGTRYGGRYVRSVDGIDEHGRRAWFYYVNGYLADRGAAEYRLRAGDVEWWDFRPWRDPAQDPVVVGSFPEPFLHGYDGMRRPAVVAALDPSNPFVRQVARRLHARAVVATAKIPGDANVLFIAGALTGVTRFEARLQQTGAPPGSPVRMLFFGDMRRLAAARWPFRFRYEVRQ
jgi:Domain of unknown function (DUF4430)